MKVIKVTTDSGVYELIAHGMLCSLSLDQYWVRLWVQMTGTYIFQVHWLCPQPSRRRCTCTICLIYYCSLYMFIHTASQWYTWLEDVDIWLASYVPVLQYSPESSWILCTPKICWWVINIFITQRIVFTVNLTPSGLLVHAVAYHVPLCANINHRHLAPPRLLPLCKPSHKMALSPTNQTAPIGHHCAQVMLLACKGYKKATLWYISTPYWTHVFPPVCTPISRHVCMSSCKTVMRPAWHSKMH